MGIAEWTAQNWFDLLSALGIVASLLYTAASLRSEATTRRVANLLTITANHREVWKVFLGDARFSRVLDVSADTGKQPITEAERVFVTMMILHVNSVYFSTKNDLVVRLEGWRRDISQFLSLPIPGKVWEGMRALQNDEFAAFVESCRNWK